MSLKLHSNAWIEIKYLKSNLKGVQISLNPIKIWSNPNSIGSNFQKMGCKLMHKWLKINSSTLCGLQCYHSLWSFEVSSIKIICHSNQHGSWHICKANFVDSSITISVPPSHPRTCNFRLYFIVTPFKYVLTPITVINQWKIVICWYCPLWKSSIFNTKVWCHSKFLHLCPSTPPPI
jgi:hypothetical protein